MVEVVALRLSLPTMREVDLDKVRKLEGELSKLPQADIETLHLLHAGMYQRTIKIPAGVTLTGALIKRSTSLVVSGHCLVYIGEECLSLHGYHIVPASAGRKQAFVAVSDTYMTMSFATQAKTVEQAEEEFTDEAHLLMSRSSDLNKILITGE
jgi:hypothetical protein